MNGLSYTFPTGSVIGTRSFLVLAKNRSIFAATYGNAVPVFDEFSGNLQNDGETISLIKPGATSALNVIVDRVRYDVALPWPATAAKARLLVSVDRSQPGQRARG